MRVLGSIAAPLGIKRFPGTTLNFGALQNAAPKPTEEDRIRAFMYDYALMSDKEFKKARPCRVDERWYWPDREYETKAKAYNREWDRRFLLRACEGER